MDKFLNPSTQQVLGTLVTIYGMTPETNQSIPTAVIGFDIDAVSRGNFTGASNAPMISNTPFFHADGLSSNSEHTVVVTAFNTATWYLDYIVYTAEAPGG